MYATVARKMLRISKPTINMIVLGVDSKFVMVDDFIAKSSSFEMHFVLTTAWFVHVSQLVLFATRQVHLKMR